VTRKIFGKVMWVGRTAATVFGLALVMALVFGVATTAIGATGGKFILGKANGATTVSKLTASVAGPALVLVNNSTAAAATALNISVASGKAPLKVNAAAGTATGLSADELDGRDSSQFANATHPHSGGDITSGTVTEPRIDATVTRDGEVMNITKSSDGAGSGLDADTLDGQNSSSFASSSHNHDDRYYTEGEVNTALSGKANTTHQHSGTDITSGTVEADRIEDGAGSNLNADQLDGKDSSAFGIRTEHNWAYAHDCDTVNAYNECAPVTVTVPDGRTYYASVWSTFSAKHSEGFGASQEVFYCSAGKGSGISTSNPCITPFGLGSRIELDERLSSASSSGESIPLSAGTYTFFTGISPDSKALGFDYFGRVITKVMIRDAANGL
jgi:hypothetical protein